MKIGRWFKIDPLAEDAYGWTPYRFGFNNPISFSDPSGLFEGWVEGPEGEVAWDPNTNSQEEFDQNYDGQEGYAYVSDEGDPWSYTLPSGEGRFILHEWGAGGEDGIGRAEITLEFETSNVKDKAGWVQTQLTNIPGAHDGNVRRLLPSENLQEYLDGGGEVQQSDDLAKARYYHGNGGCCGVANPILEDWPMRSLNRGAQRPVVMRLQSSVVLNGKSAVPYSLIWGFTINSVNTPSISEPPIIKGHSQMTQYHQNAVQSLINKLK